MRDITFGAMIPQGWIYDLPPEASPEDMYDLIVETAKAMERLDFTSGWFYDHFHPVPTPGTFPVFECWTMTTAIAAVTSKLRIGQMVTCNSYRNPALLAKMAACVDVLSRGRLEFGLGAGWYEHEYDGYGYEYPSAADRIRMMDEAIQVMRMLWEEERVDFHGRFYQLKGAYCSPKPVQKPRPPVTIGGGGEKLTLRSTAKWADRSNFFGEPEEFARKSRILDEHCRTVGRNPDEIERSYNEVVVIAEDSSKAMGRAEEHAKRLGQDLETYRARNLIGDPEEVAQFLNRYLDVGVTYFVVYFPGAHEIDPLELFAREVIPRVREKASES
ncbi:MAG: LLM class F420-dependent oxidoreductase [Thermoplasmata archaeon]